MLVNRNKSIELSRIVVHDDDMRTFMYAQTAIAFKEHNPNEISLFMMIIRFFYLNIMKSYYFLRENIRGIKNLCSSTNGN